jgi:hypothetical protein
LKSSDAHQRRAICIASSCAAQEKFARPADMLNLPLELRDQIYTELLCPPAGLKLQYDPKRKQVRRCLQQGSLENELEEDRAWPAILRVSRDVYEEARPILYGKPTFVIQAHPQSIFAFLQDLPQRNRETIRSLAFHEHIPLPSFVINFAWWRVLSPFLSKKMFLSTVTIRPSVEPSMFEEHTFEPAPTSFHASRDCWWPPARCFVSALMDGSLQELRLQYAAYRNPRTGQVAVFKSDIAFEDLFAIKMLRIPHGRSDEEDEVAKIEEMKETGSVGIKVRAYNNQIMKASQGRSLHSFTITRKDIEVGKGQQGLLLVLKRDQCQT